MIEDIRTTAVFRAAPGRCATTREASVFGPELQSAIELRSTGADVSAHADRQTESQQIDRTIKSRRMLDKRGQGTTTAPTPSQPSRPAQPAVERPAQAAEDAAARNATSGTSAAPATTEARAQRSAQSGTRESDKTAASDELDGPGGLASQAGMDAPEKAKTTANEDKGPDAPLLSAASQTPLPTTNPGAPALVLPGSDASTVAVAGTEPGRQALESSKLLPGPQMAGAAPASGTGNASRASATETQVGMATPRAGATGIAAIRPQAGGLHDSQASSPVQLAISRSEAPEMIAASAAQLAPTGSNESRGVLEARHPPREPLPQTAAINWLPNRSANESGDDRPSADPQSAARLLDAINGMRQATSGSPSSEPGSGFAASLANVSASIPLPESAVTAPVANPLPLQDPEFPAHLAGQVSEALLAGLERAEITVSPRELGPIRVELALSGENASVAFSAAHPDTREAIERSLPTLETMLAEHGLTLSHSSVGDGAHQSAGRHPDRESPAPGESIRADRSGSSMPARSEPTRSAQTSRGLLDLFA